MSDNPTIATTRAIALVGPYLSGKTTLLEALLFRAEAVHRKGHAKDGSLSGDSSPEAKARSMSTEPNIADLSFLGDAWTVIDCPGSVELGQDALNAMMVADMTVVVCEPDPAKALTVSPLLKFLDDHDIPHLLFINKIDHGGSVQAMLEALQAVSNRPLVLREIPIREGETVVGFVDLVSERAFRFEDGAASKLINMPDSVVGREEEARAGLLETLADFDDTLLEELLEDVAPTSDEVYQNLTRDLADDLIVPVLFGSAEHDHGIGRLLKLLRHEAPDVKKTAERLGVPTGVGAAASVFKVLNAGQQGKLSIARVWTPGLKDGATLNGERVGGLFRFQGGKTDKIAEAAHGSVVALGRLDGASTGALFTEAGGAATDWPAPLEPLYALAIGAKSHADEVKLSGALQKICEEDVSLQLEHNQETGDLLLKGQGDQHLQIALERLANRFHIEVATHRPLTAYKETIRTSTEQHARHKKQSGGHGEFGDVHITIKPLPRGSGFAFTDTISGGAVPKQYIPAVEAGAKEALVAGPLGFPVVDLAVTLTDGQFHSVDSSEMAFKKAAAQGMRDGLVACQPVLLEPIHQVAIDVPVDFTSKVQRLISGRRGQILGFDAKDGWSGWDRVSALMPEAEMHDLINELRSLTLGLGVYFARFDHLEELHGKGADQVVAERKAASG
ncbi:MAG: elongation factor G [Rhodospirillales bacterium]